MGQAILFTRNFDDELAREAAAHASEGPRMFSEADLAAAVAAARSEAHAAGVAEGHAAGLDKARGEIAAATAESLEALRPVLDSFAAGIDTHQQALERQMVGYARGLCETLFPRVLSHFGAALVEDRLRDLVRRLQGRPGVSLILPPEVAKNVEENIPELTSVNHDRCGIHIVADPDMAPTTARLTWSDGFAAIDQAALTRAILADLSQAYASTSNMKELSE